MEDVFGFTPDEWTQQVLCLGGRKYQGPVVFNWIHEKHVCAYEDMTSLSRPLRQKLAEKFPFSYPQTEKIQRSSDGTRKYLFVLSDGKTVECVLMSYSFGWSACISTQAGCRMGCRFCASTLGGLERNLTAGEMASEVYAMERDAGVRVSHIVLMGCGEPFDNYDQVMKFLCLMHESGGKNISYRNLTVSTCGLPDKIRAFADSGLPVTLAVSLHAPNDVIRRRIMKIAQAVPLKDLMDACDDYTGRTNRRITYEYLLIRDVNDSPDCARELSALLSGRLSHVNVIAVNTVKETGFIRPKEENIQAFIHILEKAHVPVSRRRELGSDIDAACGQLRAGNREEIGNGRT